MQITFHRKIVINYVVIRAGRSKNFAARSSVCKCWSRVEEQIQPK